jgi:hypothetical protein
VRQRILDIDAAIHLSSILASAGFGWEAGSQEPINDGVDAPSTSQHRSQSQSGNDFRTYQEGRAPAGDEGRGRGAERTLEPTELFFACANSTPFHLNDSLSMRASLDRRPSQSVCRPEARASNSLFRRKNSLFR